MIEALDRGVRAASQGKEQRLRREPEMFDSNIQILVRSPSQALPMKIIIKGADKIEDQQQILIEEVKVAKPQANIQDDEKEEEIIADKVLPEIAFCDKKLLCGHECKGVKDERQCLPCLDKDCVKAAGSLSVISSGDELCSICFTSELNNEACSKLSCGHVFHTNCVLQLLQHKWSTLRINFSFMSCPSCKSEI